MRTGGRPVAGDVSDQDSVIVLIGKNTASRPWVDWEIDLAHRLGKRIIGVYEWGELKIKNQPIWSNMLVQL